MGYGDEIMASAAAREMKRADPLAAVVIGDGVREVWHEIFAENPNVTRLADVAPGQRIAWLENYYGCRPYLDYSRTSATRQSFRPFRARPGDLFFSAAEREYAGEVIGAHRASGKPLVSIEPNVAFGANKNWGFARWQQVADALEADAVLLQPSYGQPVLRGVAAVRSPSFRSYAAVMTGCDLHLGAEGGLHHAAAAIGCPAVVVFGGRIDPALTGYAFHVNLYRDIPGLPGSPCGMIAPCAHCRSCLDSISVAEVVAHARSLMRARRMRSRRARREIAPDSPRLAP